MNYEGRACCWGVSALALTRVLFCVWDSLVATKYCTGANTAMTVAPIKALSPKR